MEYTHSLRHNYGATTNQRDEVSFGSGHGVDLAFPHINLQTTRKLEPLSWRHPHVDMALTRQQVRSYQQMIAHVELGTQVVQVRVGVLVEHRP